MMTQDYCPFCKDDGNSEVPFAFAVQTADSGAGVCADPGHYAQMILGIEANGEENLIIRVTNLATGEEYLVPPPRLVREYTQNRDH
jgi:hypothetical protein